MTTVTDTSSAKNLALAMAKASQFTTIKCISSVGTDTSWLSMTSISLIWKKEWKAWSCTSIDYSDIIDNNFLNIFLRKTLWIVIELFFGNYTCLNMLWLCVSIHKKSIELSHVKLVSTGTLNDDITVKHILKLQLVQTVQVAFQGCIVDKIQRKEDLSPGILSGWAKICLSWRIIIAMALPWVIATSFNLSSSSKVNRCIEKSLHFSASSWRGASHRLPSSWSWGVREWSRWWVTASRSWFKNILNW